MDECGYVTLINHAEIKNNHWVTFSAGQRVGSVECTRCDNDLCERASDTDFYLNFNAYSQLRTITSALVQLDFHKKTSPINSRLNSPIWRIWTEASARLIGTDVIPSPSRSTTTTGQNREGTPIKNQANSVPGMNRSITIPMSEDDNDGNDNP